VSVWTSRLRDHLDIFCRRPDLTGKAETPREKKKYYFFGEFFFISLALCLPSFPSKFCRLSITTKRKRRQLILFYSGKLRSHLIKRRKKYSFANFHFRLEMISHFWNLCRACPALDVDKVNSHLNIIFLEDLRSGKRRGLLHIFCFLSVAINVGSKRNDRARFRKPQSVTCGFCQTIKPHLHERFVRPKRKRHLLTLVP